jgi:hypothetical protein
MGFVPTKADSDLWIRNGKDGGYSYISSYIDDVIIISQDPMVLIENFNETYSLKGVGTQEFYLGGNYYRLDDPKLLTRGIRTALSAKTYIVNTIEKFERMFGGIVRES